jgi:phosphatidylinositol alpha-1,6-mannosyltransferase
MVLHSIKDLISQGRDVIYYIVGEGPELQNLRHEAKRIGIEEKVVFAGSVPLDLVWRYYSAADIFVQPSTNIDLEQESFGMTYVEASLFNVPVIAGRSGAVNEVVINNETGIVVDGKNMNDLTKAIIKIIDDDQFRERITKNAYKRAITIFSAKAQIDKMVELIEKN